MVATLEETTHLQHCDSEPICQIACAADYPADFTCDASKDPTPKDSLNSRFALNVLIAPKFGVQNQYAATCGPNSDPSGRIGRGMQWVVDKVGPDVLRLIKMFPINFLIGKSKTATAKKQVAAGTALCLNPEFQQFWIHLGKKCAKEANGKMHLDKILAAFRAEQWKDPTIKDNIAIVDTVDKWGTTIIRSLFEAKLKKQNEEVSSSWKWDQKTNIFWHYTAYLANLRASCKCAHLAQTLEKGILPDGKNEPTFVNLPVLAQLRNIGRQVCAAKFAKECKPKGNKVLDFDSESNTEDIENAL
jgi:hypothetical protein